LTGPYRDMAQVAYDRTVATVEMRSTPGEMRVVVNTFNTYFGVKGDLGHSYRLHNVIGRYFWMATLRIMQLRSKL